MPPITCRWIWTGDNWAEHPGFPHNCPENHHCEYPATKGTFIDEETDTSCVPD